MDVATFFGDEPDEPFPGDFIGDGLLLGGEALGFGVGAFMGLPPLLPLAGVRGSDVYEHSFLVAFAFNARAAAARVFVAIAWHFACLPCFKSVTA